MIIAQVRFPRTEPISLEDVTAIFDYVGEPTPPPET